MSQKLIHWVKKISKIFSKKTINLQALETLCNNGKAGWIEISAIRVLVNERYETKYTAKEIAQAIRDLLKIQAIEVMRSSRKNKYCITQIGIELLYQVVQISKNLALKSE
jgi:predicted transcriptional regulator